MTYYVVCMTEKGVSSATVSLRFPIKTYEDVRIVADIVKKETKSSTAVVLNWKELEK